MRDVSILVSDPEGQTPRRNAPALRLGLRQIDGINEEDARKIVDVRDCREVYDPPGLTPWLENDRLQVVSDPSCRRRVVDTEGQTPSAVRFTSIQSLWTRAGVKHATLEKLAAADAFRSVQAKLGSAKTGLDRRQALWQVKALTPATPLPLFSWSETQDSGAEPDVTLPEMALSEHVVNDYQTLRLSLKAHPMSFLREDFKQARVIACSDVRTLKDGARVAVAGVILVRQRPGSAKGVVFMTIEDETGIANAVVWPKMLEKYRKAVMTARLILIEGRIQRHEDIIHIVSGKLTDRSDWLLRLSEWAADMKVPIANADEVRRPDPGSARGPAEDGKAGDDKRLHPRFAREPKPHHPRYVRIIPKSRDFH